MRQRDLTLKVMGELDDGSVMDEAAQFALTPVRISIVGFDADDLAYAFCCFIWRHFGSSKLKSIGV